MIYPLTHPQKRIWYMEKIYPNTPVHNIGGIARIKGLVDLGLLEEAINILIIKNDGIRLQLIEKDGEVNQYISDYECVRLDYVDFSIYEKPETEFKLWVEKEARRLFQLINGRLFYFALFKITENNYGYFAKFHHLIFDAWSVRIMTQQIGDIYVKLQKGQEIDSIPGYSYIEFIEQEQKYLLSGRFQKNRRFWIEKFKLLPELLLNKSSVVLEGNRKNFEISKDTSSKIKEFATASRYSLNSFFVALYLLYLNKMYQQDDLIIGTPVSNRSGQKEKNTWGMFVSTMPFRFVVIDNQTISEMMDKVNEELMKCYFNQKYPYDLLTHDLEFKKKGYEQIFNSSVNYYHSRVDTEINGLPIESVEFYNGSQIHSLELIIKEWSVSGNLLLEIGYKVNDYTNTQIDDMYRRLKHLINQIIANPSVKVGKLSLLSTDEKNKLLFEFNNTESNFPKDKTICKLFEEQVAKAPDRVAVSFKDQTLTYGGLNEKSNQLARVLLDKGVKKETIVGLLTLHSIETVIGILGVLKAGGAYLPIDPGYPTDRIAYMLEDSGAGILIANCALNDGALFKGEIINLDDPNLYMGETSDLDIANDPDSLAYIIYTSGSTGKPKGTMIGCRALVNYICWAQKMYLKDTYEIFPLYSSLAFDLTVTSVFLPLTSGNGIIVYRDDSDEYVLYNIMKENRATILKLTPSHLSLLKDMDNSGSSVKKLIVGGEDLKASLVKSVHESFNANVEIFNEYGPTETTVGCMIHKYDYQNDQRTSVPVGIPASNTQIYILDKYLEPVPNGCIGEIYISGEGMAKGYLNRPDLTAEKFIPNPFVEVDASLGTRPHKMYKTGDLARFLDNGRVEYAGRSDSQVKIRGYRIETGEIEKHLLNYKVIADAVVIKREDVNRSGFLCAYITGRRKIREEEVKEFLRQELPEYMIPIYFVQLEKLPVTLNGKVDKDKLPPPELKTQDATEYEAPRNEIETRLVEVWEQALGKKGIGIRDNFFKLGGDSIKAIQIVALLRRTGLKIEVKDILSMPEIKDLSKAIKKVTEINAIQGLVEGEVELTPIQTWFFNREFALKERWNQAVILNHKGKIDTCMLKAALNKLLEHHDALRMVYRWKDGSIRQFNRGISGTLYEYLEIESRHGEKDEDTIKQGLKLTNTVMNLEEGPLVKVAAVRGQEADYLVITIHHLVIDGVSWRIIVEDLEKAYQQVGKGIPADLGKKSMSYKEWAEVLRKYAVSEILNEERPYWEEIEKIEAGIIPGISPERKEEDKKENSVVRIQFSVTETQILLETANSLYKAGIHEILAAALGMALYKSGAKKRMRIYMEGHGREEIMDGIDLSRTVGWFTSRYPIIIETSRCIQAIEAINLTKGALGDIPRKGIGYGILKYASRDTREDKYGICLNYMGQFDGLPEQRTSEIEIMQIAGGASLGNESAVAVEINGIIAGGKLVVEIAYESEYVQEVIAGFAAKYKESISEIIWQEANDNDALPIPGIQDNENITGEELQYQIEKIYPLSPMQEGILFHAMLKSHSKPYFEQIRIPVYGLMDENILKQALKFVIKKHDALRTNFRYEYIEPKQFVFRDRETTGVFFEDISYKSQEEKEQYLKCFLESDIDKGFDLAKDALLRMSLFRLRDNESLLVISFHHIIMDGWSTSIIIRELFEAYESVITRKSVAMDYPGQYKSYIDWLKNCNRTEAKDYWREYLADCTNSCHIPEDSKSEKKDSYRLKEHIFGLGAELTAALCCLASSFNVTLNTVMQTVWGILLQRYNNTDDAVFGVVVSGRNAEIEGIEKMVGLFINTIPLRIKLEKGAALKTLMQKIQLDSTSAMRYSYLQLSEIMDLSSLKAELVNHLYVFENYPTNRFAPDDTGYARPRAREHKLKIGQINLYEQTNYNFNIIISATEELTLRFNYNGNLYSESAVKRIASHIRKALNEFISNPEMPLETLEIISREEKQKVLYEFNDTDAVFDLSQTIDELFHKQALKNPGKIALVFENKHMTYSKLDGKSALLSSFLRAMGVRRGDSVAVMMERTMDLIVSIIAILKAGGVIVPVDNRYPSKRKEFMLRDCKASWLLISGTYDTELEFDEKIIDIRNAEIFTQARFSSLSPQNDKSTSGDILYIIYTSGTTGNPKGVMIEQRNLLNLIFHQYSNIEIDFSSKVLQFAACVFDVFYQEVFSTLLAGGELHITPEEIKTDAVALMNYIDMHKVNVIFWPTAFLKLIINDEQLTDKLPEYIRHIITAGEQLVLSEKSLKNLTSKNMIIWNHYGPSETHVVTTYALNQNDKFKELPPIGKPIANNKIFILDRNLNLQPINVTGEIYISGANVGRGYLNRTDLTKEKFVPNPFVEVDASQGTRLQRMYKTGDLARWLENGNIEFIGRADHQVKISGYRIEPGEIESRLLEHQEIKNAAVMAWENNDSGKYLCAYFVADKEIEVTVLKEFLRQIMPEYMIPSYFIQLTQMPLTANGKVDRKALPLPCVNIRPRAGNKIPSTEIEAILRQIWKEVLNIGSIGVDCDFFEIGGNSLNAIKIIAKASSHFPQLSLNDIYQYRTIEKIARYLESFGEKSCSSHTRKGFNASYVPERYPIYFVCAQATVLEKLRHEYGVQIEKTIIPLLEGNPLIGCGYTEGGKGQEWFLMNIDGNYLIKTMKFGNIEITLAQKKFGNVDDALEYCREQLGKNKLVLSKVTTYHLKFTPDYHIDAQSLLKKINYYGLKDTYVFDGFIPTMHVLLLVDITESGFIVFDSNFDYFGEIPSESFKKALEGLCGVEFMKDHSVIKEITPFSFYELEATGTAAGFNNRQVGIEAIKSMTQYYLSSKKISLKSPARDVYVEAAFGLEAFLHAADFLKKFKTSKNYQSNIRNFAGDILFSWKEAYQRLRDFTVGFGGYIDIPDEYRLGFDKRVSSLNSLNSECENIQDINLEHFADKLIREFTLMYQEDRKLFSSLSRWLEHIN